MAGAESSVVSGKLLSGGDTGGSFVKGPVAPMCRVDLEGKGNDSSESIFDGGGDRRPAVMSVLLE